MKDVAGAAGVSTKTVSRVINHEPSVDRRTAGRVEAAIAQLDYRMNDAARSLRKGTPQASIGLVIEDLSNPFYAILAGAVEEVAQRNGHALLLTSSGEDAAREQRAVRDLLQRRIDGLLIVPAGDAHAYLEPALRLGTRMVFIDRPPEGLAADAVILDNREGAQRAVDHLIAHGHRRIAYVGDPPSVWTTTERLGGYRDALARSGLPIDDALIRTGPTKEAAEAVTRQLLALPDPPTAIFAHNNRNCVGVLRALQGSGARLGLVAFDDFELADMLETPVTVIGYDPGDLGRVGAELLFARLAGDARPPQTIAIRTRLVPRGSGEVMGPGPERPTGTGGH